MILKNIFTLSNPKQILEQLRNKEYREMAWKIYRGHDYKSHTDNDSEIKTLQNLDKQIKEIKCHKSELENKYKSISSSLNIIGNKK